MGREDSSLPWIISKPGYKLSAAIIGQANKKRTDPKAYVGSKRDSSIK